MTSSGQLIANRFEIQDLLGRGGMGEVYRAIDIQSGETVAVKALNPEVLERDPSLLERFVREGEALRQLNHPNIVRMVTAVEENGRYFLVMEYVGGGSLQDLLSANGQLPHKRVIQIALDLADALTRAHRLGIIHRDLKPANVLLAEDGTPRLADFGIAHIANVSSLTQTGIAIGSIDYLSPEACRGETPDERTDIWSFGVLLFQLLTGEKPFKGDSMVAKLNAILTQKIPDLSQLAPDAPDALIDLVYRMLEKDAQQRIPSIRLVGAELEALLKGREPVTPSHPVATERRFETPALGTTFSRNNLPTQATLFIGREAELMELSRLLSDPTVRLLSIVGVGGMGKTRLAIEAGKAEVANFERGVYFVPLAGLENVEAIVPAIAKSLDFSFYEGGEPRQQLLDYLREKHMLIIIDNFEQMLKGAYLVSEILQNAPKVKILVTSRAKLNVLDEHIFHLEGMGFPDWETPEEALEYSAVKLFLQSAQRAKPGFKLASDDLKYVARICGLVGGMPLGILLAAAWVEMLSLSEILAEIEQSIDFLETKLHDVPDRQRSIRAVFDYSWKLINEKEQKVLRGLSVFRGGFAREAAQQVTGATLRELMGLVDKSLIHRAPTGRYDIHGLLRQYAHDKLSESGEKKTTRDRHREWFLALAEQAMPELHRETQMTWLDRLDEEHENLRAALDWTLKQEEAEISLRFAAALAEFWNIRYYKSDALKYYEKSLSLADNIEHLRRNKFRAHVLLCLGNIAVNEGDVEQCDNSRLKINEALEIFQELDDKVNIVDALVGLSYESYQRGDLDQALSIAENSLHIARLSGDKYTIAYALGLLSTYLSRKDYHRSRSLYEEHLEILQIIGDRLDTAITLCDLGILETELGNVEKAENLFEQALSNFREMKIQPLLSKVLRQQGWLASEQGRYDAAIDYYQQSLMIAREIGDRFQVGFCLWKLGQVSLYQMEIHKASAAYHEGLNISTDMKLDGLTALMKANQGFIHFFENEDVEAETLFRQALPVLLNYWWNDETAKAVSGLGDLERRHGKLEEAMKHYSSAINLISEFGRAFTLEYVVESIAKTISDIGEFELAVRILGAATSIRKKWNGVIHPVFREEYDKYVTLLREKLGDSAFEALWAEGEALSIEQTIELALWDKQK